MPITSPERQTLIVARLMKLAGEQVALAAEQCALVAELRGGAIVEFIIEHCDEVPGATIPFVEFSGRFQTWLAGTALDPTGLGKLGLIDRLPDRFPYGVMAHNIRHVGNITWKGSKVVAGERLIQVEGRLQRDKGD